jgi:hypothetical protein
MRESLREIEEGEREKVGGRGRESEGEGEREIKKTVYERD